MLIVVALSAPDIEDGLGGRDGGEEVQDLLYWTKGAVLAGADGDIDLFSDCLNMAKRSLREVQAQFSVH